MISQYKPFLHCLFVFVFVHSIFLIAQHQYHCFSVVSFWEHVLFPLNLSFDILAVIHLYIWGHAAVPYSALSLSFLYATLLIFALFTIHFSLSQARDSLKQNLVSAFFGIYVAHIAVGACLAVVDNPTEIYRDFLMVFNNWLIVLISAVYILFYVKRFKFTRIKNNVICSNGGFFTGLFYQLLIASGTFTHSILTGTTFTKAAILNFMLLALLLILSMFITGFLQKSLLNSYNKTLHF